VHYDLKAVGSARRCIGLREEALGHRGQRIGAPRRVWDWPFLGELGRDLILRKGFERSVQRLDQHCARCSRQSALEHQAAVLREPVTHSAIRVLPRLAGQLLRFLRPAKALHQSLHMMGGAVQSNHEQGVFGRRASHSRQCPGLGIAQFPA